MRIWFALIVAPLLALGNQSVAYLLVGWSCAHQSVVPLHACHALFLVIAALAAVAASREWRAGADGAAHRHEARAQRRFLAGVATAVAALSALAIAAMWIATGMISPCTA
jgi:4'-phosphopantetheinyl transferase EntD